MASNGRRGREGRQLLLVAGVAGEELAAGEDSHNLRGRRQGGGRGTGELAAGKKGPAVGVPEATGVHRRLGVGEGGRKENLARYETLTLTQGWVLY